MLLQLSLHPITVEQGGRVTVGGGFDIEVLGKTEPGTNSARVGTIQTIFDYPFFPLGPCLASISPVATGGLAGPHQLHVRTEGGISAGRVSSKRTWGTQEPSQGDGGGGVAEGHDLGSTFR